MDTYADDTKELARYASDRDWKSANDPEAALRLFYAGRLLRCVTLNRIDERRQYALHERHRILTEEEARQWRIAQVLSNTKPLEIHS